PSPPSADRHALPGIDRDVEAPEQVGGERLLAHSAGSLRYEDVRQLRRVRIGFVALNAVELRDVADSIVLKDHLAEPGGFQDGLEHRPVVEELMAPSVKRLVHLEAVPEPLRRGARWKRGVMRYEDPVEIGSRDPKNPRVRECPPAVLEERERLVEADVLQKVLGVDRGRAAKGQSFADVEDAVHARQILVVDVDPSGHGLLAAPDVKPQRRVVLGLRSLEETHRPRAISITRTRG